MSNAIIRIKELKREFTVGSELVRALKGVDVSINKNLARAQTAVGLHTQPRKIPSTIDQSGCLVPGGRAVCACRPPRANSSSSVSSSAHAARTRRATPRSLGHPASAMQRRWRGSSGVARTSVDQVCDKRGTRSFRGATWMSGGVTLELD